MKKEKVTTSDIDYLAKLSALSFTEDEKKLMVTQVSGIIEMLNACADANVDNEENVNIQSLDDLRDDESGEVLSKGNVFTNTPKCEHNYVVVPKVVE